MKNTNNSGLDFIGDIHGYGSKLEELLATLGYVEVGKTYEHPLKRQVVFLGDYIDRGSEVEKTLQIVKSMTQSGSAMAIMGNHEYNAICFQASDGKGDFLRSHKEEDGKNVKQHQSTLDQYKNDPEKWNDWIEWFRSLPFYLDGGTWRAVHAAWDFESVEKLSGKSLIDDDFLFRSANQSTWEFKALEKVLKGLEVELPEEMTFKDHNGNARRNIRVSWWKSPLGMSYRDIIFPPSAQMPEVSYSVKKTDEWKGYSENNPPVFFGHYWIPKHANAEPLASNVACLDYSVAESGGKLTAYRWDGEKELSADKFVQV